MPERQTLERARRDAREGKAPSTQAGEFVREEMEHIREGKHGARSTKQAIAIGLSKARRAGVKLAAPKGAEVAVDGEFPNCAANTRICVAVIPVESLCPPGFTQPLSTRWH